MWQILRSLAIKHKQRLVFHFVCRQSTWRAKKWKLLKLLDSLPSSGDLCDFRFMRVLAFNSVGFENILSQCEISTY